MEIIFVIGIVILGALIGLAIAASIFRAACRICNVENIPGLSASMGIVFLASVVSAIINFGVGLVIGLVGTEARMGIQELKLLATLVGLPLGMLTSALVYKPFLNASFGKCILVWLMQIVIIIAIGIVVGLVIFGGAMILGTM